MSGFHRVRIDERVESVSGVLNRQSHVKVGFEPGKGFDEEYIRAILCNLVKININAFENIDGTLVIATDDDRLKVDSLFNFYNNNNSVDSRFYLDLAGIDASFFDDRVVHVRVLSFPFTDSEKEHFLNTVSY